MEIGKQMLNIAESRDSPILRLWAYYTLGFAAQSLGENQLARDISSGALRCTTAI